MQDYQPGEATKYLTDIMTKLDATPFDRRSSELYYKRNFLFYSWLLQKGPRSKDRIIEWSDLLPLLGPEKDYNIIEYIFQDSMYSRAFVREEFETGFLLQRQVMTEIQSVFNEPAHDYRITASLPYMGSITGEQFVRYLNKLDALPSLTTVVANALKDVLGGYITLKTIPDELLDICLVIGPENNWHFLLVAHPYHGVLDDDMVYRLLVHLTGVARRLQQQDKLRDLQVLLLAPAIASKDELALVGESFPQVHHLWSLSSLRFIRLLNDLANSDGETSIHKAAQCFMAVFEERQHAEVMWAREAIDHLKKKL